MKLGVTPTGGAKAGEWARGSIFTGGRCFSCPSRRKTLETKRDFLELGIQHIIYPLLYSGAFGDFNEP